LPPDRGITYPATVAGGRDAAEAGSRRDRERAGPHAPEPRSTAAAEDADGGRGRGGETRKRGGEEGRGEDEYVLAPRMSVLRVPGSAPGPRRERAPPRPPRPGAAGAPGLRRRRCSVSCGRAQPTGGSSPSGWPVPTG